MSQKQSGQASLSPILLMRFIYIYVPVCIRSVCVYHLYSDAGRVQERVLYPWSYTEVQVFVSSRYRSWELNSGPVGE